MLLAPGQPPIYGSVRSRSNPCKKIAPFCHGKPFLSFFVACCLEVQRKKVRNIFLEGCHIFLCVPWFFHSMVRLSSASTAEVAAAVAILEDFDRAFLQRASRTAKCPHPKRRKNAAFMWSKKGVSPLIFPFLKALNSSNFSDFFGSDIFRGPLFCTNAFSPKLNFWKTKQ